jgi:DNA repair exonuclease SbcCD nuclease subunit
MQGALLGDGVVVYSEPTLQPLNDSRQILFLPYRDNKTMGELIAQFSDELQNKRWILVSHGDWTAGRNTPEPYEQGLYLPLTRADLQRYQPELVFLGHIHLAQEDQNLYYPGSPCPINISETGLRRFLILDTQRGDITSHLVDCPLIYFDEHFIMLPTENGLDQLVRDIEDRISGWNLPSGWAARTRVRLRITGSSRFDKQQVLQRLNQAFSGIPYYQEEEPQLSGLIYSIDPDRVEISSQINQWIADLDWKDGPGLPTKTQILDQAFKVIHGGKS